MIEKVIIIYNPNSTGDARKNAESLSHELAKSCPSIICELLPTEYAQHAEKLAREVANGSSTMIISSSGDGGFHEVVNGVLASKFPNTIVGVLPSGNANDHYHSRHSGNLVERIASADIRRGDVLSISWSRQTRYAHSYIGLGISADIGHSLTKTKLNPINEIMIAIGHFLNRRTVRLRIDDTLRRYDSVIYAVVSQMSKYFDTGADMHREPGEFIVVKTRSRGLWHLLSELIKQVRDNDDPVLSVESESFRTTRRTKVQCDGEIIEIPTDTNVTISCETNVLFEIV